MKNLEEIEIRNNSLTFLGYQILFNVTPSLKVLDIRNSRLCRKSIELLCDKLPNITSLYLSETGIDDAKLYHIAVNNTQLNVLYSDNNAITYEGVCEVMCIIPHLYFISVKNTKIDKIEGKILEQRAQIKGCLIEY